MSLETIYEIPLEKIQISDDNVRDSNPMKDLEDLAASISKHGLLQPVVLLGEINKTPYKLISGQRRFFAHKKLDKETIRAVFVGKLDKTQAIVRSLVENMQRVDLEYEDTSRAITYLYENFKKDERKVQKETGLSLRKIRDFIKIEAQATPVMKDLLKRKKVSPADVKRALRAAQDNISKAEELLNFIAEKQPSWHQKKRIVQCGEREKSASAKKIFEDAMKPQIEQNVIINLTPEVRDGLNLAVKTMEMEPEELAAKALSDWLKNQGFLK